MAIFLFCFKRVHVSLDFRPELKKQEEMDGGESYRPNEKDPRFDHPNQQRNSATSLCHVEMAKYRLKRVERSEKQPGAISPGGRYVGMVGYLV